MISQKLQKPRNSPSIVQSTLQQHNNKGKKSTLDVFVHLYLLIQSANVFAAYVDKLLLWASLTLGPIQGFWA